MADMIDWRAQLKDNMFSMFMLEHSKGEPVDAEHEKETLKEYCARLIRMATQKTAGQRGKKGDLDTLNTYDLTLVTIAICACRLCLNGEFGEMPDMIEGDSA